MLVRKLDLDSFRNYDSLSLSFEAGVTVFIGRNGQGKTNIVEAINFASSLASHRVQTLDALIKDGTDRAVIRLALTVASRELSVDFELNRKKPNRAQLNKKAVYAREIPKMFHAVLFSPEDLSLLRGEPASRRRFLDDLAMKVTPGYQAVLGDYERAVKQRNALLRVIKIERRTNYRAELDLWDTTLSELGTKIVHTRVEILKTLEPLVVQAYRYFTDMGQEVTFQYEHTVFQRTAAPAELSAQNSEEIRKQYHQELAARQQRDIERGQTSIGPHRDEIHFFLKTLPVKGYASHGETWSYALAIKLAVAELLRLRNPGEDPVLILDDVFAELDVERRQKLAEGIVGFQQVFITAAVEQDVPELLGGTKIFISNGAVINDEEGESGEPD